MGGAPALGPIEPISNVDATFQAPTNKTQLELGKAKNTSAESIAAGRNTSAESIAAGRNQTTLTKADKDNEARAEVARLRGATAEEVARIRSGGKAGAEAGTSPLDLNRRAKLEEDAVKAVVSGFSAGDSVKPEQAALIASAALTMFPNDPPNVAVQKFMQSEGIKPGSQVFGSTEFLVNGKPYDFDALRARLFSAGGAQTPQAAQTPSGATVVPREVANAFIPPSARGTSKDPIVIQPRAGQPQAVQPTQPQAAPAAQQPAAAPQPAAGSLPAIMSDMKGAGVLKPDAQPGFNLGGVDFGPGGSTDTSQFTHGETRLVTPNPNSAPVPMYWNADTGKFQSEEPSPQLTYEQRVRRPTSPDNVNTVISTFDDIANGGYQQSGAVKRLEGLTGGKFSSKKYASLRGQEQKDYVMSFYNDLVTEARGSYLGDPRIDQFAAGDFGEVAVPRAGLKLMDLLGGNRKAFGVKDDAGFSESMPWLGALDMADFGDLASPENRKKLQGFFQAVQEGRFDPVQMKVVDKPKSGRSIDGTEVYEPSDHRVAAVQRGMSKMPDDSTLAKAIADRTGPGIVGKAGANLAKAGQNLAKKGENLVNLGKNTGAATADFFRKIGPGSIKVRSKEDQEADQKRNLEVLRKSREEADAKDAERERKFLEIRRKEKEDADAAVAEIEKRARLRSTQKKPK